MDKREHPRKLPPLASSEDLSEDLLDSPEADAKSKCLEGIAEVPCGTPAKSPRQQTLCLAMPNAPRIDISRASSSSHHDDSSPERDLFVGESPIRLVFIVPGDYSAVRGWNEANARVRCIRRGGRGTRDVRSLRGKADYVLIPRNGVLATFRSENSSDSECC